MSWFRQVRGRVELALRVTPNAGRDAIIGIEKRGAHDVLRVKVAAAPDKGKANQAVIGLLAKSLGLRPSAITLIAGETSRDKRLRIEGDEAAIEAALRRLTQAP